MIFTALFLEGANKHRAVYCIMQQDPRPSVRLPIRMEEAIQIAWDYLERVGEIEDPELCNYVLSRSVETMIRQGVESRLLLSNKAIMMYERLLEARETRDAC